MSLRPGNLSRRATEFATRQTTILGERLVKWQEEHAGAPKLYVFAVSLAILAGFGEFFYQKKPYFSFDGGFGFFPLFGFFAVALFAVLVFFLDWTVSGRTALEDAADEPSQEQENRPDGPGKETHHD
jgi:hypothetical protein